MIFYCFFIRRDTTHFISRLTKNGQKWIRFNVIHSTSIKASIRIHSELGLQFQFGSIRVRIPLDRKLGFDTYRLISWIEAEWSGLSWIDFWLFFIRRDTKHFLSRLTKNGQKWIRFNPIHSTSIKASIRIHPELGFKLQFGLIWVKNHLDWKLGLDSFGFRYETFYVSFDKNRYK